MEMPKDQDVQNTESSHEAKDKEIKSRKEYKNEITRLKGEVDHWKNEYYRAYADTKNLRSSLEKDQSRAIKYRAEGFIDALLPILDSFHLALQNEPTDPAMKNYLTGFQYVYRNLVAVLENEGVKEIAPAVGEKFNPDTMNAADVTESDGEEGKVAKVYAKGYQLHDRMVRHAVVSVTAKPKAQESEKTSEKSEEKTVNKFDA